ncbi:MAG TPA: MmgE/PrpD family protein [Burkholderiales bacterium]|nr:MmgE/PrpD family protein [Burkholderiales bacterium]
MDALTRQLASFVAQPHLDHIPDAAIRIIRTGFIDTMATMLAGAPEPVTRIVLEYVREKRSSVSEASVLPSLERASAADAALVNGVAAHALDYDDVALGGHPSTVLVPTVLAQGEALGVSGEAVLRAYLVGYEVWAELIGRERDTHHTKGWHPTAVFGTVASAASAAHLARLDAQTARHALAIAASLAAGLTANFGTMTKPFHAGRAAANGIEAVKLAQADMTASADAFEHAGGFLAAFSPQGNVDRLRPASELGKNLAILGAGLSIKKYPMCYATHRVIDGVLDLARDNGIGAADVEHIEATIGEAQVGMLRNHDPVTGLEAKFSLEFAVACALVAGKVGLAQLTDAFVNQAQVKETMRKVSILTTTSRCPVEPIFAFADRVVLRLKDGRTLDSGDIRFARGNAKLPLADPELHAKFIDCASLAPGIEAQALFERLIKLERLDTVHELLG